MLVMGVVVVVMVVEQGVQLLAHLNDNYTQYILNIDSSPSPI